MKLAPFPLRPTLVTLAFAAAGGGAFAAIGLPAPWLSGSMVGAAVALVLRLELAVPDPLRDVVLFVLGASMGAGVTPETLEAAGRWPASLVSLAVVVVAVMVVSMFVLARFEWDRTTSFYASAPGALSTVLILADRDNAAMPRVVVAQSLRLFVLVAVLPSIVVAVDPGAGGLSPTSPATAAPVITGFAEYVVIAAAAGAGAGICYFLRVPAGLMIGALVGSALVHGTGLVTAQVPNAILVPSFVILGAFIALRFRGASFQALRADLAAATASLVAMIVVSAIGAIIVAWALALPLAEVLVAFAPGGVEAMIIMAFALKLDVAYVAMHHMLRFLGIGLALPFAARIVVSGKPPTT